MSCPPRPDPALHLPPGIFHTRHIASAHSLRNKCCTFPPVIATIPEMAEENKKRKDELQREERSTSLILCQFTVLFQCVLIEWTHPSTRRRFTEQASRFHHGNSHMTFSVKKKKKSVCGDKKGGKAG